MNDLTRLYDEAKRLMLERGYYPLPDAAWENPEQVLRLAIRLLHAVPKLEMPERGPARDA